MMHDYSDLWPILPLWVKWIATDENGMIGYFKNKPEHYQASTGLHYWAAAGVGYKSNGLMEEVDDWLDSLQEMPERERELNTLSEGDWPAWAPYAADRLGVFGGKFEFTRDEYESRRKTRAEAGLVNNK